MVSASKLIRLARISQGQDPSRESISMKDCSSSIDDTVAVVSSSASSRLTACSYTAVSLPVHVDSATDENILPHRLRPHPPLKRVEAAHT